MITAFIPLTDPTTDDLNFKNLSELPAVKHVKFYTTIAGKAETNICLDSLFSVHALRKIIAQTDTEYFLLSTKRGQIDFREKGMETFFNYAKNEKAGIVYTDHKIIEKNRSKNHPLIDYQLGSVRDEFEFGPLLLFDKIKSMEIIDELNVKYKWHGLYSLRMGLSTKYKIKRIPQFLYSFKEETKRSDQDKQFGYLDTSNIEKQKEAEDIFTEYLKKINAYIPPLKSVVNLFEFNFENEASVIIPVKNRANTIEDAVQSALRQKLNKKFNVIVVDNHSNDGTTETLREISNEDKRLIHIIPGRTDLNIGGCWNLAVSHADCGKFSVQLDSDDLYSDENSLQKIIDKFYKGNYGIVIASYLLTDFEKKEIPPGAILHREWTDENGHNNALRVNGFGAPRAFYTPVIRKVKFPDVSYGEDYAACLTISGQYKVGRIFEPLYLCRRWSGNSDANLSINKENEYNYYKDSLRTKEIKRRMEINKKKIEKH